MLGRGVLPAAPGTSAAGKSGQRFSVDGLVFDIIERDIRAQAIRNRA